MVYKLINQENLYTDKRLTLYKDTVLNPNNNKQFFTYIKKRDAVLIIAEIENKIILIKQSRYLSKNNYFELPGGTIEKNETPENAALREIEEETGYRNPKIIEYLGNFLPLISITTEKNYIFYMKDLDKGFTNKDSTEFDLTYQLISKKNLNHVIENNMISAPDMLALYKYIHKKKGVENGKL